MAFLDSEEQNLAPETPDELARYLAAIAMIESGRDTDINDPGRYSLIGPMTRNGSDRAVGKYQVMASNIGPWTSEVLGKWYSTQDFINDPEAQERVARVKFEQAWKKHGSPEDAASVWFSGRPIAQAGNANDLYTSVPQYISMFRKFANTAPAGQRMAGSIPPIQNPDVRLDTLLREAKALSIPGAEGMPSMDRIPTEEEKNNLVEDIQGIPDLLPQVGVGMAENVLALPPILGAGLNEIGNLPRRVVTHNWKEPSVGTRSLLDAAQWGREKSAKLPGLLEKIGSFSPYSLGKAYLSGEVPTTWTTPLLPTPEPKTAGELAAKRFGGAIFPAGPMTIPMALGITGAMTLYDPEPGNKATMAIAAPVTSLPGPFPGMVETGNIDLNSRPVVPLANGKVATVRSIGVNYDGKEYLIPTVSPDGKLLTDDQAKELFRKTGKHLGIFDTPEAATEYGKRLSEAQGIATKAKVTVPTASGPQQVDSDLVKSLLWTGAITIGFMAAPSIFKALHSKLLPKLPGIDVPNAAPGTKDFSKRSDLLATNVVDANSGILNIARRIGVDPALVRNMEVSLYAQTRGQADLLSNSFITNGRFETPSSALAVKTPVAKIHAVEKSEKAISDYLYLRSHLQEFSGPKPPTTIRGVTQQDMLDKINLLEQRFPILKQVGKDLQENNTAVVGYASKGEYATMTKQEARDFWKDNIPFSSTKHTGVEPVGLATEKLAAWMKQNLSARMENEAKGLIVDGMQKTNANVLRRVTKEELAKHPEWMPQVVTIKRRGVEEHYTAAPIVADMLRIDPFYFVSPTGQAINAMKHLFESSLTGTLAPHFAPVNMARNFVISQFTTPKGMKAPGPVSVVTAIPQQLIPETAKSVSVLMDRASGGWLGKVFGPQNLQGVSLRLADVYNKSLVARLEQAGSHRGSFMQIEYDHAANRITQVAKELGDKAWALKPLWDLWRNGINAIHNAPEFAFAKKNINKVPVPELAMEGRNLSGNPRIRGQYASKVSSLPGMLGPGNAPIRGPVRPELIPGTDKALDIIGRSADIARVSVPYFNPTVQGIRRLGQAYLDNPVKFTAKAYAYVVLPETLLHFYYHSAGTDPQGISYRDYAMNRRSDWAQQMYTYIPIPGKPAWQGMEIPRVHELSGMAAATHAFWDHAMSTNLFKWNEDVDYMLKQYLGVTAGISPPIPYPQFTGMTGRMPERELFGGKTFQPPVNDTELNPYGNTMPSNLQTLLYGIVPGLAQTFGAFDAAFTNTDTSFVDAVKNGLSAAGRTEIKRTPIVRDIVGANFPAANTTRIRQEYRDKEKAIKDITFFMYKLSNDDVIPMKTKGGGISAKGQAAADKLLGNPMPETMPGLALPEPTNPLYKMFATELKNRFDVDSPSDGGIGMKSLTARLKHTQALLGTLYAVNPGNQVLWQKQLAERPEVLKMLKEANVDYTSPDAVKSFYTQKYQDDVRLVLFRIKAVEQEFSKMAGRPIRIQDLKPYGKGLSGYETE